MSAYSGLYGRLVILVLSFSLVGCGFQLRSYGFEGNIESVAITGMTRAEVVGPLRQNLRRSQVPEKSVSEADLVVEILDQRNRRRSASTTGGAGAAEYEVDYSVQYQILNSDGEVIAEPTWIERQRTFTIDRGNIVGSNQEQTLLRREILDDAAGQIVRALSLVSRAQQDKAEASDAG